MNNILCISSAMYLELLPLILSLSAVFLFYVRYFILPSVVCVIGQDVQSG